MGVIMGKLILTSGNYLDNINYVDAIVNSQNKYMQYGSGICGIVCKGAGSELLDYCQINYSSYMNVGEVRITPGFNLKKDIIHILAPKYYEETNPIDKLLDVYGSLLNVIKEKGYKKVLMCSLGAGIHGYKHEDIFKPVINLLNGFCRLNDVDIYFNNKYTLETDLYLKYYLTLNKIDLYKKLVEYDIPTIKEYMLENGLCEPNIKLKYKDFVKGKELNELCLTDKKICMQYTIENFTIDKSQLDILIESIKENLI